MQHSVGSGARSCEDSEVVVGELNSYCNMMMVLVMIIIILYQMVIILTLIARPKNVYNIAKT